MNIKERAAQLKTDIPAVFLALKDSRTPLGAKILGVLAVGYALSPIDLIPDFIPVLGYLDDIILLPVLIGITIKMIPAEVMEESRGKAKGLWENGKPEKWYYSIPVVVFWVLILYILIKAVLP